MSKLGIIVLGHDPLCILNPRKEDNTNEQGRFKRKGPPGAGKREGRAEAAPRSSAHAIRRITREGKRILDGLRDYGSVELLVADSARFLIARLETRLFRTLPYRARLYLEVPTVERRELRERDSWVLVNRFVSAPAFVPDIRAWSVWVGGPRDGKIIQSHHAYPDQSMCVCMPTEWELGRDPLVEYADFCTMWIAKALHEMEFGSYPGRQHYPPRRRVERDRSNEYCGCGSQVSYHACHRPSDFALTPIQRLTDDLQGRHAYLTQLQMQERAPSIPRSVSQDLR